MSEPRFTRPALWEDVVDLARKLNRHGARYILVGGYAEVDQDVRLPIVDPL